MSKFLVAFNHLHDILNTHIIKFDNNQSSSFGDYLSNKKGYRHQTERQTDRQTETGIYFFCTVWVMKRLENIKVAFRLMDSITILDTNTEYWRHELVLRMTSPFDSRVHPNGHWRHFDTNKLNQKQKTTTTKHL